MRTHWYQEPSGGLGATANGLFLDLMGSLPAAAKVPWRGNQLLVKAFDEIWRAGDNSTVCSKMNIA